MNIDKLINQYEKIAIDNEQIMKALDNKTKIILYTDLDKYKNINELLQPHDNVVLLYQTTNNNFGHWTCIWKKDNTVYFFDPYGMAPDTEIKFCPYIKKANDQYILSNMLKSSVYAIETNKTPYQSLTWDKKIVPNTCGRHCIVRLKLRHLNHDQYKNFMKSAHYDSDKLVSIMTFTL
jgi:hypothetical protein